DLPDDLSVALHPGRVQPARSERRAGRDRDGFAARLPGEARGPRGAARAVAPGLLARPDVHRRRRGRADRLGAGDGDRRLHALERRRPLHDPGAPRRPGAAAAAAPGAPALDLGKVAAMAATRAIRLQTEIPGPRSRGILERKARVVADPLSTYLPVVVAEGRGSTLTDVDGNSFLD